MADDIFNVEPPRWLEAIAQPIDTKLLGQTLGSVLAGATTASARSHEQVNVGTPAEPKWQERGGSWLQNFLPAIGEARLNLIDPMWRLKANELQVKTLQDVLGIQTADAALKMHRLQLADIAYDNENWPKWMAQYGSDPIHAPPYVAKSQFGRQAYNDVFDNSVNVANSAAARYAERDLINRVKALPGDLKPTLPLPDPRSPRFTEELNAYEKQVVQGEQANQQRWSPFLRNAGLPVGGEGAAPATAAPSAAVPAPVRRPVPTAEDIGYGAAMRAPITGGSPFLNYQTEPQPTPAWNAPPAPVTTPAPAAAAPSPAPASAAAASRMVPYSLTMPTPYGNLVLRPESSREPATVASHFLTNLDWYRKNTRDRQFDDVYGMAQMTPERHALFNRLFGEAQAAVESNLDAQIQKAANENRQFVVTTGPNGRTLATTYAREWQGGDFTPIALSNGDMLYWAATYGPSGDIQSVSPHWITANKERDVNAMDLMRLGLQNAAAADVMGMPDPGTPAAERQAALRADAEKYDRMAQRLLGDQYQATLRRMEGTNAPVNIPLRRPGAGLRPSTAPSGGATNAPGGTNADVVPSKWRVVTNAQGQWIVVPVGGTNAP